MKFKIEKSFDKDIGKIEYRAILEKIRVFISKIENANNIKELTKIKKLQGYGSFYRYKIGDYRIGFEITSENEIILIRCLHRKEIYRYFPKRK